MSAGSYLLDTSVFVRFFAEDDALHTTVTGAIARLTIAGAILVFTPQISRESWAVLTRPIDVNGYGFSTSFVRDVLSRAAREFAFFEDTRAVYDEWMALVSAHDVRSRQVHDAYHVAAMKAHGLKKILTLDRRDFARYPGVEVVFPADV